MEVLDQITRPSAALGKVAFSLQGSFVGGICHPI